MKRRDFVKAASVAAGAAVIGGHAAPVEASSLTPEQMDEFLRRLDAQLDGISRHKTLGDVLPPGFQPRRAEDAKAYARGDKLFRSTLRSLLMVGVMHDLPEKSRLHPGMQERLRKAMPEIDGAAGDMLDLLGNMTPADRIDIAEVLERDPELPMRVIEAIDREGATIGISRKRREHLRALGARVAWRVRHQSFGAVIDEYVDKAKRVMVQHKRRASRLDPGQFEVGFFAPEEGESDDTQPVPVAPQQPATPMPVVQPPERVEPTHSLQRLAERHAAEERKQKAQTMMNAGGAVLGIGTVTSGVFIALTITTSIWFAFGITAGAVMLVIGIIFLIVGAVRRAAADEDLARLPAQ
jgi:hypothetical protein